MKKFLLLLLPLCVPCSLRAQPETLPDTVRDHELTRQVLDRHYLHITGEGSVEVPYSDALRLMEMDDLLTGVQTAYTDLLEEGEEPEFVIELQEDGSYRYVNQEEQETVIVEMLRARNDEGQTEIVLYSKGRRSFGRFQALTHVRLSADPEQSDVTHWTVQVFAYPENGFSRFFARTFGIAQRYFTKKTADISQLTEEICLHLLRQS